MCAPQQFILSCWGAFLVALTISRASPYKEKVMPKGIPKTEGEKIGDKFDKSYRKMRLEKKSERAAKKDSKEKECDCGKK